MLARGLQRSMDKFPEAAKNPDSIEIRTLLQNLEDCSGTIDRQIDIVRGLYSDSTFQVVQDELQSISMYNRLSVRPSQKVEVDLLIKLGILEKDDDKVKAFLAKAEAVGLHTVKQPARASHDPLEGKTNSAAPIRDTNDSRPLRQLTRKERLRGAAKSKRLVVRFGAKYGGTLPASKAKAVTMTSFRRVGSSPLVRKITHNVDREKLPNTHEALAVHEASAIHKALVMYEAPAVHEALTVHKSQRAKQSAVSIRAPDGTKYLDVTFMPMTALETDKALKVPQLSYGLSRVLFNPGVYQVQDPRSRVFNFDPYLADFMPVQDFNFAALPQYITSSQDELLKGIAQKHDKRYVGSTSSMSGAMSQFHFLLSAWRPVNFDNLSSRLEGLKTFTTITRAPAAIFLRWKDGVYAIDADKEFDSGNILMMQGKSMEKLLTLSREEFEKYRKPKAGEEQPKIEQEKDSYHYTGMENFLLRSQLDAYDPRLPGTGMFDIKTRAVAGIRMNMSDYKTGMGYQVKDRYGQWESFEREYLDMIRSAFLKYSLQVRMGRMDGIFVAYHNIARIFGFQYISIDELDVALHGQSDRVLGDREFKFTIKLLKEIFDTATKEFPQQSIKFLFDVKEPTERDPQGQMQIFAEPMTSDAIKESQKAAKGRLAEYERKLLANESDEPAVAAARAMSIEQAMLKNTKSTFESNAPDKDFLDALLGDLAEKEKVTVKPQSPKLAHWVLRVYSEVNDQPTLRPTHISNVDKWVVKYELDRKGDEGAQRAYNSCKNRRAAALSWDLDSKVYGKNSFKNRIVELSEDGRKWREEQDELDAQRGTVVYDSDA